ncbi:MAG TPA: hypothetical protein VIX37_20430 [Candidatus Sulfotelmatobacter sp.]
MIRQTHRLWQVVFLVAVLSGTPACLKWPDGGIRAAHNDKALFDRAETAVEQERFDVANLTLQTLVNTYPDSEYADRARLLLEDPRIAPCGESWNSASGCNQDLQRNRPLTEGASSF